jgi:hypothetical protein
LPAGLEREVFRRARQAGNRYRLKDLGRSFPRPGAGFSDFHEFITIQCVTGDLTLIVAADN